MANVSFFNLENRIVHRLHFIFTCNIFLFTLHRINIHRINMHTIIDSFIYRFPTLITSHIFENLSYYDTIYRTCFVCLQILFSTEKYVVETILIDIV